MSRVKNQESYFILSPLEIFKPSLRLLAILQSISRPADLPYDVLFRFDGRS